jgi:hypothetical protein
MWLVDYNAMCRMSGVKLEVPKNTQGMALAAQFSLDIGTMMGFVGELTSGLNRNMSTQVYKCKE